MIERLCNLLTQTWQYESIRVISEQNEWRAATRQLDNQAIRQLIRQSDSQIIDHANLSILLRASQLPSSDTSNYACFVPVTDTVVSCSALTIAIAAYLPQARKQGKAYDKNLVCVFAQL
jgi:hypothetical protein